MKKYFQIGFAIVMIALSSTALAQMNMLLSQRIQTMFSLNSGTSENQYKVNFTVTLPNQAACGMIWRFPIPAGGPVVQVQSPYALHNAFQIAFPGAGIPSSVTFHYTVQIGSETIDSQNYSINFSNDGNIISSNVNGLDSSADGKNYCRVFLELWGGQQTLLMGCGDY